MGNRESAVNTFLRSKGYAEIDDGYKPYSAMWYMRTLHTAKLKLAATIHVCSNVPVGDTALFSSYAFILSRQCRRYQFVFRRAYLAFGRETWDTRGTEKT